MYCKMYNANNEPWIGTTSAEVKERIRQNRDALDGSGAVAGGRGASRVQRKVHHDLRRCVQVAQQVAVEATVRRQE